MGSEERRWLKRAFSADLDGEVGSSGIRRTSRPKSWVLALKSPTALDKQELKPEA